MSHTSTSTHTQDTFTPARQGEDDALGHILPAWFQRFQEVAFLPLMIAAEMLINGVMMASGLIPDPNNPFAGGTSHWLAEVTWLALFMAGAVMGGMAIRTSAAASYWFSRSLPRALFNVIGMFGFVSLEVWAGIVQRSQNTIMSPADTAALSWVGVSHPSVSITDVVVALALPLAAMFWGFSNMKPASKSAAEIRAEGEARLARAQVRAQLMQTNAAGLGGALRAGAAATFARQDDSDATSDASTSAGQVGGFDPDNPGGGMRVLGVGFPRETGVDDSGSSFGKPAPSSRTLRPVGQVGGVPAGWVSAAGLMTWARDGLGVEITREQALAFIKAQSNARQCSPEEGVQGRPWIAPKASTLQAAKRKWGARITTQVSGE